MGKETIIRKLIWFLAGAMALVLVIAVGSLIFLKTRANGFSARAQPSALEEFAAQTARKIAVPEDAKNKQNRVPNSAEVLAEAKEHWADHCATCHANDGSGENAIGRQMYPIVRHKYIRL
jgi:cytochrome c553